MVIKPAQQKSQSLEQGFEARMLAYRTEVRVMFEPSFLDGPELDRFLHAVDRLLSLAHQSIGAGNTVESHGFLRMS